MSDKLDQTTTVVVFAPGTMGSTLNDPADSNGRSVWPDKVIDDRNHQDRIYNDITDSTLVSGKPIDAVILDIYPVYKDLVKKFEDNNFKYYHQLKALTDDKERKGKKFLVGFPYDWRRENVDSAQQLAAIVDRLPNIFHNNVEIWIAAHSMGGLISRYALETGQIKSKITGLITLGTPHQGAPKSLAAIVGQGGDQLFSPETMQRIVNNANYPTTYELLPNYKEFVQEDSTFVDIWDGPFNLKLINTYGAVSGNFQKAAAFWSKLNGGANNLLPNYTLIAGTGLDTIGGLNLIGSTFLEQMVSGDGTVPQWSAGVQKGNTNSDNTLKEFPGISHMELVTKDEVLEYLVRTIEP